MRDTSAKWLDAAAFHPGGGEDREEPASEPHIRLADLKGPEKREVAEFALAAATTCAFMLTPLMMTGPITRALPASSLAIQFAAAPLVKTRTVLAGAQALTPTGPARLRTVKSGAPRRSETMQARAEEPRPPLQAAGLQSRAAVTMALTSPDTRPVETGGLRRGVARVLFGTGRYRVRPFPAPASEEE
jgi:hypothetical protein